MTTTSPSLLHTILTSGLFVIKLMTIAACSSGTGDETSQTSPADGGCNSDDDCKGDRICQNHLCTSPSTSKGGAAGAGSGHGGSAGRATAGAPSSQAGAAGSPSGGHADSGGATGAAGSGDAGQGGAGGDAVIEEGPDGDGALIVGEPEAYVSPGGDSAVCEPHTPFVDMPWLSQKLSTISTWKKAMCCGPTSLVMAEAYLAGSAATEQRLIEVIDWMAAEYLDWKKNDYRCSGTTEDKMVATAQTLMGLKAGFVTAEWCALADKLDGKHVVIIHADAQGTNASETFVAGDSHWVILDRVEGAYSYINDPGRGSAGQGKLRKFTTESVRARYEARGKLAIVLEKNDVCVPSCEGRVCGPDGCGGVCGVCGDGASCVGGLCEQGCVSACQIGEARCLDASTRQDCVDSDGDGCGEWGKTATCAYGCAADACKSPSCPDGARQGDEQCDGADLGGASCQSLGHDGGSLGCASSCTFDTSSCCDDACTEGATRCLDGKTAQLCGHHGGSACTSWGGDQACGGSCEGGSCCGYHADPAYPDSTTSAPYSCPGGIVMPISGEIADDGTITVISDRGPAGNAFQAGDYAVRVFDPNDPVSDQCTGGNWVKSTEVQGVGTTRITFTFASLLTCESQKAYCITKAGGGVANHFCSGRLLASQVKGN